MHFSHFPHSDIDIVAPDGSVRHSTRGIVTSESIVLEDTSLIVELGDEIRRKLPNGREEVFVVDDPRYYEQFHSIPAHYQLKYHRRGDFPAKTGGHYNVNVSGQNARVNIGSQDHSTNIAAQANVYDCIADAVKAGVSDPRQRQQILEALEEFKREEGASKLAAYQKFVAVTADHITLLAPFLPAMTKLIG